MYRTTVAAAAAAALCAANIALADDVDNLPPAKTVGPVTFVTGGVGERRAHAFERAAKNYPLELEFVVKSTPRDEFTANVDVRISDAQGKTMLATLADGPFLLAKRPAGSYKIEATQNGKTLVRRVNVPAAGHEQAVFAWPA